MRSQSPNQTTPPTTPPATPPTLEGVLLKLSEVLAGNKPAPAPEATRASEQYKEIKAALRTHAEK